MRIMLVCSQSKHIRFRGLREDKLNKRFGVPAWIHVRYLSERETSWRMELSKGNAGESLRNYRTYYPLGWLLLPNLSLEREVCRGPQRSLRCIPAGKGELEAGSCWRNTEARAGWQIGLRGGARRAHCPGRASTRAWGVCFSWTTHCPRWRKLALFALGPGQQGFLKVQWNLSKKEAGQAP